MVAQQRGEEQYEEQCVLDDAPPFRRNPGTGAPALGPQPLQHRPQGTEPAAPGTPKEQRQRQGQRGEAQPGHQRAARQRRRQRHQRVQPVEQIGPGPLRVQEGRRQEEIKKQINLKEEQERIRESRPTSPQDLWWDYPVPDHIKLIPQDDDIRTVDIQKNEKGT